MNVSRWTQGARRAAVVTHARVVTGTAPEAVRRQEGQTTVEYALVMLGVASVAGLLLAWVRGTDMFEKLFDKVVKSITP